MTNPLPQLKPYRNVSSAPEKQDGDGETRDIPKFTEGRCGLRLILFLLGVSLAAAGCRSSSRFDPKKYPNRLWLDQAKITVVAESERPMDRVVMGLGKISDSYYLLEKVDPNGKADPTRLEVVRKSMYWIDLEMVHGHIWNVLPSHAVIFMGVPVEAPGKGSPLERKWFEEYLRTRWGWSQKKIDGTIRFFDTPTPVVWGQDIGEMVGFDAEGRNVIVLGADEPEWYHTTALNLARAYPDDFVVKEIGRLVSTEGGDVEMVWAPGNRPTLMAGRFAALRYLQRSRGDYPVDKRVPIQDVFEARDAFQKEFFGLPVEFLPLSVLQDPARGDPELFHLDMIATFFADAPVPRAFVPTYLDKPYEATNGQPLKEEFVKRLQNEYNRAALELTALGYKVERLPFADHPVRGPANLVKYFDREIGRQVVLLPKYPDHQRGADGPTAQERIRISLYYLQAWGATWQNTPDDAAFSALMQAFGDVWQSFNDAATGPDPVFSAQREILEKCGYLVIPVPMFVWGAGGLHCLVLH